MESSWSQTNTYSDVSVFADLIGFGGSGAGIAYLTTSLGPGTTPADQVAVENFTFPTSQQNFQLFSGLDLGPGTYYLTMYGTGGWGLAQDPSTNTVTEDTGATLGQPYDSNDLTFPTYIPAADYSNTIACCLVFAVEGTPVPEPNQGWLIGSVSLALVCWKLYRWQWIHQIVIIGSSPSPYAAARSQSLSRQVDCGGGN